MFKVVCEKQLWNNFVIIYFKIVHKNKPTMLSYPSSFILENVANVMY